MISWYDQSLQRPVPSVGPPNPLHHDEVRIFRDNRGDDLRLYAENEI
jgi:hypothetical protein